MSNSSDTLTVAIKSANNRRQSPRMNQEGVWSRHGQVLDLSRSGMRLRTPKRVRGLQCFCLYTFSGRVFVQGTVMWCRRRGIARFEAGIAFTSVDEQIERLLREIALTHGFAIAA